ncbi:MAG TPA: DUF1963 domain-containing protein [Pirellulales bacterium]
MSNDLDPEFTYDLNRWTAIVRALYPDVRQAPSEGALAPAVFEALRSMSERPHLEAQPVDAFVLGLGEPSRRDVTKINGLPYRPRTQPWPHFAGSPMQFFAQIRLRESRDWLPGPLPGDLLLLFADLSEDQGFEVEFEWQNLGIADLPSAADIPTPEVKFLTAYGVRHRTVNYLPQYRGIKPNGFPLVKPDGYPNVNGFPCKIYTPIVISALGTESAPEELEGCDIAFYVGMDTPLSFRPTLRYPFVNRPSPATEAEAESEAYRLTTDTHGAWVGVERDGTCHLYAPRWG